MSLRVNEFLLKVANLIKNFLYKIIDQEAKRVNEFNSQILDKNQMKEVKD